MNARCRRSAVPVSFLSAWLLTAGVSDAAQSPLVRSSSTQGQGLDPPREAVTLTFTRRPQARRTRNESSLHLDEYVVISAVVGVRDGSRRPVPAANVTFSARFDSGVFKSIQARTDDRGEATLEVRFDVPPGALGLSARACLTERAEPCTPIERLSLRDWVDFGLAVDVALLRAGLPEGLRGRSFQPLNTQFAMIGAAAIRPQINVWEHERDWRYYRLSLYGHVPYVAEEQGVGYSLALPFSGPTTGSYESLDATAGLADWSSGIDFVAGGTVFADVAYNSRSGKVNRTDALQRFGEPRLVNLGDGFESIDSAVEGRAFIDPDAYFLFARYANSHAFRRELSRSRIAARDDIHDLTGGIGFVAGQESAFLVWGGYRRFGAFRLTRGTRLLDGSAASDEYVIGVSRIALTRRRVRPTYGFITGGLGTETLYVGLSFNLNIDAF